MKNNVKSKLIIFVMMLVTLALNLIPSLGLYHRLGILFFCLFLGFILSLPGLTSDEKICFLPNMSSYDKSRLCSGIWLLWVINYGEFYKVTRTRYFFYLVSIFIVLVTYSEIKKYLKNNEIEDFCFDFKFKEFTILFVSAWCLFFIYVIYHFEDIIYFYKSVYLYDRLPIEAIFTIINLAVLIVISKIALSRNVQHQ